MGKNNAGRSLSYYCDVIVFQKIAETVLTQREKICSGTAVVLFAPYGFGSLKLEEKCTRMIFQEYFKKPHNRLLTSSFFNSTHPSIIFTFFHKKPVSLNERNY